MTPSLSWRTLLTHPESVIDQLNIGMIGEPQPASVAAAMVGGLGGLAVFGTGGPGTALLGVMMGPGLGIAALYAGGSLLWSLGRLLGGRGTPGNARAVLALSLLPTALLALLAAIFTVVVPAEVNGAVVGCFILVGLPALFALALRLWGWAVRALAAALELTPTRAHAVGALSVSVVGLIGTLMAGALRLI